MAPCAAALPRRRALSRIGNREGADVVAAAPTSAAPGAAGPSRRCAAPAAAATEIDTAAVRDADRAWRSSWSASTSCPAGASSSRRNLVTLSVQASGVASWPPAWSSIIVSRNIDLSVGSIVGFIGHVDSHAADRLDAGALGSASTALPRGSSPSASGWGSAHSSAALQGFIIAYVGVPSFIVTLGGLLSAARARSAPRPAAQPWRACRRNSARSAAARRARSAMATWIVAGSSRAPAIIFSLFVSSRRQRRASASRCDRCGPSLLGAIGVRGRPRRRGGVCQPTIHAGRPGAAVRARPTASPSRRAVSRSRPACRARHHPDLRHAS